MSKIKIKTYKNLLYVDADDVSSIQIKDNYLKVVMKNGDRFEQEFLAAGDLSNIAEIWDKKFNILRSVTA